MTDHIIRDSDGAALGIDWFALATEITNRPVPDVTDSKDDDSEQAWIEYAEEGHL